MTQIKSLLQEAVNRLVDEAPGYRVFVKPRSTPDAIPAKRGAGVPVAAAGSSKSGLTGPFIEPSAAARTFHDERTLLSSDGIFALRIKPIKTVVMRDGSGAQVVFSYSDPSDI